MGTIIFWGVLGHNIPPYSPAQSADEFAASMIANAGQIRIGMIGQLLISPLYLFWGLIIARVMEYAEEDNNIMSTLQLWGAGFTAIVFVVPCTVWLAIAYRPEVMQPQTLQFAYDFAWFFFDNSFVLTSMGMVAMGVGFLNDPREQPLMPRWVCWLAIAVAIGFVLEVFMPLVKSGPFSRSGLINYWIEFSIYFIYWLATAVYILKAITRLEGELAQA